MLLMGLAVGVDYCLFYLRREREERAAGRSPQEALRVAAATSGHSVLVSGITVMVAMAGMFLSGMHIFEGFALATILVVAIAMLGSVTVLPALLSMLGDRIDWGRRKSRRRRPARVANPNGGRVWNATMAKVLNHPKPFAALAGRSAGRPGHPRPGHEDAVAERQPAPALQQPAGADLQRDQRRVPGQPVTRHDRRADPRCELPGRHPGRGRRSRPRPPQPAPSATARSR